MSSGRREKNFIRLAWTPSRNTGFYHENWSFRWLLGRKQQSVNASATKRREEKGEISKSSGLSVNHFISYATAHVFNYLVFFYLGKKRLRRRRLPPGGGGAKIMMMGKI